MPSWSRPTAGPAVRPERRDARATDCASARPRGRGARPLRVDRDQVASPSTGKLEDAAALGEVCAEGVRRADGRRPGVGDMARLGDAHVMPDDGARARRQVGAERHVPPDRAAGRGALRRQRRHDIGRGVAPTRISA